MKSKNIFAVLLLAIAFAMKSCAPGKNNKEDHEAAIRDTMNAIIETVFSNSEKLDADNSLSRFLQTEEFSFISNGQVVSFKDLKELEKKYFETLKSQDYQFGRQHSEILSDDCAITELSGTLVSVPKEGQTIKFRIAETLIFKKINGIWQIASGHESYYQLPATDSASSETSVVLK